MRWDGFFDEFEDQLAAAREAERAALTTEAERLRVAGLSLRDRLSSLVGVAADVGVVSLDLADGESLRASVVGVGADWAAVQPLTGPRGAVLVPIAAIEAVGIPAVAIQRSLTAVPQPSSLRERTTFGFLLRDLARRRVGVRLHLTSQRMLTGTIDRAGSDHADLALHEPGTPRRDSAVTGHRVVPFAAIARVHLDSPPSLL